MAFPVVRPDLVDPVQGFGQGLLEVFNCRIFSFFQLLDPPPQHNRGIDHQRVHAQNEQCQAPVQPQQYGRCPDDGEAGHHELAHGDGHEVVNGLQVRDQVGRDRAAAQGFVFGQAGSFEPLQQLATQPVHHVLGDGRQFPHLERMQQNRREP